ncbi:MAG: alpha-L-arabinofuranosidase C-terminal domain-containing protein [Candidatus Hydrogenedentota bacterium]
MRCAAKIEADKTYASINPFIYGQFLEQTGACIYGGIWAEMLQDRKFYYSPDDDQSQWTVPSGSVEMVTSMAYAGEQSLTVWLPGAIAQAGLHIEADREYVVRLVVAGASLRGGIEVSLCWGNNPEERVTASLEHIGDEYAPITATLTPSGSSENGCLEIAGHGKGALRIGAVSLMPADHVHGMRRDVLEMLKRLNAPLYSWPGGNFTDTYNWRDGIGDRDKRPPRFDPIGNRVESNDFGFEEFMILCAEIGAEPLVVVNSTAGKVHLAVDEVRYANAPGNQGPAKLRAANGRKEPYGVTWWGMGSQQHRTLRLVDSQLDDLKSKHNALAESLRAADPSIRLVCMGGTKDQWRETVLAGCALNVDMISEQCCAEERDTPCNLMRSLADTIRECTLIYRDLLQTMPEMMGEDMHLAIDRWSFVFERGSLRDGTFTPLTWNHGLGLVAGLHQFIRDSDVIGMAVYAPAIDARGAVCVSNEEACLTAAGQVLSLYRNHFGVKAVAVEEDCDPLDVVAAWTADRTALTIGVVNPLEEEAQIELRFKEDMRAFPETCWLVTAPDANSANIPGQKEQIVIEERPVAFDKNLLTISPLSAGVYRLRVE